MTVIADPTASATMRHAMVASQLRTNAVSDQRVLAAMARVPRENFVPAEARTIAYRDTAVALGGGRQLNPPMVTGRLLTEADLSSGDRVLLIGAATGYTAAILAQIVETVAAVEEDHALFAQARVTLKEIETVELVEARLTDGHHAGAPYDVLVIDGAIQAIPDALIGQVRSGGRVVAGIVESGVTRLASGRKTTGGFGLAAFADADCVVLPGFAQPRGFSF